MKRFFLIAYAIIVTAVTVGFLIFGERRDPRFYMTILILAIVGKIVSRWIE
jgi:hypothetical protein